jgi:hypothetical protein
MRTHTNRQLDKVRVIALYILFRDGVADEDRRRLFQHARLSITEQDSVNNLVHLGAKVIKVSGIDENVSGIGPCAETCTRTVGLQGPVERRSDQAKVSDC